MERTPEHKAEWNRELRLGMHRSIAFYRRRLMNELTGDDKAGIADLLTLLEEYMTVTWPNNQGHRGHGQA